MNILVMGGTKFVSKSIAKYFSDEGYKVYTLNRGNSLDHKNTLKADRHIEKNMKKVLDNKKFDYVIATHPHEDHIGNLDDEINKYEIGAFYSPKVTHTTKAYENMIKALKKKDLKINVIKEGTNSIDLGEGTKVSVFSPIKAEYKKGSQQDFNNYSPVMKIEFGKTSFLFTGDAEAEVEKEILNKGYDVSADVLKFGHHGSSTSTSEAFLKAVNPSIGVIQLAEDNTQQVE